MRDAGHGDGRVLRELTSDLELRGQPRHLGVGAAALAELGIGLLGAVHQVEHLAARRVVERDGAGQLLDTTMVVRTMVGGVSGGTTASMLEVLTASSRDPQLRRDLEDPYTLSPDRGAEPELGGQSDVRWRRGADERRSAGSDGACTGCG